MREEIIGRNSRRIGFTKSNGGVIEVYDNNSRLMGKVTSEGTFDKNSRLVSRSQVPGLLLNDD